MATASMDAMRKAASAFKSMKGSSGFAAAFAPKLSYRVSAPSFFESSIFPVEQAQIGDRQESILRGGRHLFKLLPQAFADVNRIAVIGWGSQGPAQAQNLRESLEGTGKQVVLGLRPDSRSIPAAERKGFLRSNGTLLPIIDAVKSADLTILLISDGACCSEYSGIFEALRPNSYLGLSHGFLHAYLKNVGEHFPQNVNVIAVCPKGMGPSVRQLYVQGRENEGAGINSSIAVQQDISKRSIEVALGWSVAIGSPVTFLTSLENEVTSDLVGERGALLGGIHGIAEALYRHFLSQPGVSAEAAYVKSADSITGPISKKISERGILGLYDSFSLAEKKLFEHAYVSAYTPFLDIVHEIYDEVASGREVLSVVDHGKRLPLYGIGTIDATDMWRVGRAVQAKRGTADALDVPLEPVTAGVYAGCLMAQADLLSAAGHSLSEVINESIIEGIDSLNPYMWQKGVGYMVDNCSITAQLGSRKWAPRFEYAVRQNVIPCLTGQVPMSDSLVDGIMDNFKNNIIHKAFESCAKLRPAVSITPAVDNGVE